MAKLSGVPGLDRIRELCTAAERNLLEATAGSRLQATSRRELEKLLAQVRNLRDKWRGLLAGQARTTKRAAAAGPAANARSREKADMFAAAVERLQARHAELVHAAAPRPAAGRSVKKATRTAGHRTARAGVKATLAATTAASNRARASRPVVQPAPRAAAAVAKAAPPAPVPGRKVATSKTAKKRRSSVAAAAMLATGGGQPVRFDVTRQRSAKAKAARSTLDRQVNRRGGHALAAGKRRQAARDRRSR